MVVDILGIYQFAAPNWVQEAIDTSMYSLFPSSFKNMLSAFDLDPSYDNVDRLKAIMTHFPAGAGYRCFIHYAQLIVSDLFLRYDWGSDAANLLKYGQTTPPSYTFEKIHGVPIAMLSGSLDLLADPRDVQWLSDQLGSSVVFRKNYEH